MKHTNDFGMGNSGALFEQYPKFDQLMRSVQPFIQQLENTGIAKYANIGMTLPTEQLEALRLANLGGTVQISSELAATLESIHDSLPSAQEMRNIAAIEQMMGTKFRNLVQPSVYIPNISSALLDFGAAASHIAETIDVSWIHQQTPWLTDLSFLQSLDISGLGVAGSNFSTLLRLEKETAELSLIASHFSEMTSAAAQIASIQSTLSGLEGAWRNAIAPTQMLDEYCGFAARQHKKIQKAAYAGDMKAVAWRLNMLESTSKFVDRQVAWTNDYAADVQEELATDTEVSLGQEPRFGIQIIPQHIGYSRRDNIDVDEAFEKTTFVSITEKGKVIAQKIRTIQEESKAHPSIELFRDTNVCFNICLNLAQSYCTDSDDLKDLIENLHLLFFRYRDNIISVGGESAKDCLTYIEDLRMEQDYPTESKKIVKFQNKLYDRIILLADFIIDGLKATSSDSHVKFGSGFSEDELSAAVCRALIHVQRNKLFYGRSENELNDAVRDNLEMVYTVKDQTRQGTSESGKDSGEIDIIIYKDNMPFAPIEGLKVSSVNKDYIKRHIDKLLTKYDPIGCPFAYILIYAAVTSLPSFWEKAVSFVRDEYKFPYEVMREIQEVNHIYSDSRHAKVILQRNGKNISLHIYAMLLHQQNH